MGRSYDLGHKFVKIQMSCFKDGLSELIDIDEDMNGNNGTEYTSEEALESGFESDLEYYVDIAFTEHGKTKEAIVRAISLAFDDGCYVEHQYEILETEDGFLVSLAYMSAY